MLRKYLILLIAVLLFAPSASKKPINKAMAELKKNQKDIREAQLPGQDWERHDTALRTAMKRRSQVDVELRAKGFNDPILSSSPHQ